MLRKFDAKVYPPTLFVEIHGNVAGWCFNLLNKKITTLL